MTSKKDELETIRRKRVPINGRRVLHAKKREGYYRRFVNDVGDRVQMFLDAGYAMVTEEGADQSVKRAQNPSQMGSPIKKHVGGGIYAYLMEIPLEFYREDFERKQAYNDEIERSYNPEFNPRPFSYGNKLKQT